MITLSDNAFSLRIFKLPSPIPIFVRDDGEILKNWRVVETSIH